MKSYCLICFRDITHHQNLFDWLKKDAWICGDCRLIFKDVNQVFHFHGCLIEVLYEQSEELDSLIMQYQEVGDIALRSLFFHDYVSYMQKHYKGYTLVWMPSGKVKERGLETVKEMLDEFSMKKQELLECISDDPFYMRLRNDCGLKKQKVLLVDVYFHKAKLQMAFDLLKPHVQCIHVVVLCGDMKVLHTMRLD